MNKKLREIVAWYIEILRHPRKLQEVPKDILSDLEKARLQSKFHQFIKSNPEVAITDYYNHPTEDHIISSLDEKQKAQYLQRMQCQEFAGALRPLFGFYLAHKALDDRLEEINTHIDYADVGTRLLEGLVLSYLPSLAYTKE